MGNKAPVKFPQLQSQTPSERTEFSSWELDEKKYNGDASKARKDTASSPRSLQSIGDLKAHQGDLKVYVEPTDLSLAKSPGLSCCFCGCSTYSLEDPRVPTPCCSFYVHNDCYQHMRESNACCSQCNRTLDHQQLKHTEQQIDDEGYIHHFGTMRKARALSSLKSEESEKLYHSGGSTADDDDLESLLAMTTSTVMAQRCSSPSTWLSSGETVSEAWDDDVDIMPLRGENIAITRTDLEDAKDYFLKLWLEAESSVKEEDKIQIIQDIVQGSGGK